MTIHSTTDTNTADEPSHEEHTRKEQSPGEQSHEAARQDEQAPLAPATEEPSSEESVSEESVSEGSVSEELSPEEPVSEAPASEAPASEAPASETPASETPASETPTSEAQASQEAASEASASEDSASEISASQEPAPPGSTPKESAPQREDKPGAGQKIKTQALYADPEAELAVLAPLVQGLSERQTVEINALGNRLGEVRKQLPDNADQAKARGAELHLAMVDLLARNKTHQEAMSAKAGVAIEALKEALEAGNSDASLAAWDKCQAALSPLSGKLRNAVQKQLNEHRTRYQELKDWKLFASAEKKKELIAAMQLLLDSDTQGGERAKAISAAHQEWKSLGRSQQNESLWKKFKKLSDLAYAPCKDHFKQRKGALAENYTQRLALCDSLEADLSRLGDSPVATAEERQSLSAEVAKIVNAAEERWKSTAPVEQSKIKELQKRYYAVLNALRKMRREAGQENARLKQEAIAAAEALAALDDRREAMREAKSLQRRWKEIGPSNHKDDQAYWKAFRAACDKIFSGGDSSAPSAQDRRGANPGASRLDTKQVSAEIERLFAQMEALLQLDEEAFRQARASYQDLSQAFAAALDPRLGNRRKQLTEQFNTLKRRFDTRYKSLPDKRQQQRIATVAALTERLDTLESSLLAASSPDAFASSKAQFDPEAWASLERPDDAGLCEILETRLSMLQGAEDSASILALSKSAEEEARRLCVELEISANAETPGADQALRMQLQLQQLKAAFGQAKQSTSDALKHARDEQLRLQCLGPLATDLRRELQSRFDAAAAKLGRA